MSDREGSQSHSPSPSPHKAKRSTSPKRSRSKTPTPRRKSRSRSNRGSRSRSRRGYHSRSRSRSYDRRRYSKYDGYDRSSPSSRRYSGSRSPMSSRRRHMGDRTCDGGSGKFAFEGSKDHPRKSRCLGVFGLSLRSQERDIREIFERYGPIDDLQLVYDHHTGRSRGFGFVYMKYVEDAIEAKEKASGMQLDGRNIRIDYSITERAHTPTPGVYMGRTSGATRYGRRSPSPYKRGGRYSRSCSRSRSNSRRRY